MPLLSACYLNKVPVLMLAGRWRTQDYWNFQYLLSSLSNEFFCIRFLEDCGGGWCAIHIEHESLNGIRPVSMTAAQALGCQACGGAITPCLVCAHPISVPESQNPSNKACCKCGVLNPLGEIAISCSCICIADFGVTWLTSSYLLIYMVMQSLWRMHVSCGQ